MISEPRARPAVIINGLAAVVALVALVIGVPVFLAAAVGWPLPHGLPSINDISDVLAGRTPFPDAVWIDVLACIGWLSWARVSSAVVAETALALRGRDTPSTRHGLRHGIARLVAAVVLVVSTTVHRPAPAVAITALPRLPAITEVVGDPMPAATPPPATAIAAVRERRSTHMGGRPARHAVEHCRTHARRSLPVAGHL